MKEERVRIHRSDDRVRARRQYAHARNRLRYACSKLYLLINYRNELFVTQVPDRRKFSAPSNHKHVPTHVKHLFLSV